MSIIGDATEALVGRCKTVLTSTDPIQAAAPSSPVASSAYVWAGDPWVSADESSGFCNAGLVTLAVDLVAGTTDLVQSQKWLADRVEELWLGCSDGVDVGVDTITPATVARPSIVQTLSGGVELLVVRVDFTPFRLEN